MRAGRRYRGIRRFVLHAVLAAALVALLVGATSSAGLAASQSTFIVPCSTTALIADLEAANDEISYPGADTLTLTGSCTYSFVVPYGTSSKALPAITTPVTIYGNGAHIVRVPGSPSFGLFRIAATGDLLLDDVTLAEGTQDGANIDNAGSATLVDTTITHSVPYGQGGAGVRNTGVLGIVSSTIEYQRDFNGMGGGITNSGQLFVSQSTITGNMAQNSGGLSNTGYAEISDTTFTGNINDFTGGAIGNSGELHIVRDSFVDNGGGNFGGAISNAGNTADLYVNDSYFERNKAIIAGGAIHNSTDALAQVVNSTFYRNTAASPFFPCCVGGSGGAIANEHGVRVQHSTFLGNGAGSGAAVASPNGILSVEASILSGGSSCSGNIVDFGSTLVYPSAGSCPSSFVVSDPKLTLPALRGGDTMTIGLGPGSPAVDMVPTAGCPAHDQRGVARPVASGCDAGALEDQRPSVPGAPSVTAGGYVNKGVFTLSWAAATDPDKDTVSYRLFRQDTNDSVFSLASISLGPQYTFSAEDEGTIRYKVVAEDGNLLSGESVESAFVIVDRTAPNAPTATADRAPDAAGWYRDTVTVTFSGSIDPPLADGSGGSGVSSMTAPQTRATSGQHAVIGKATDAAGNDSSTTTITVKVDAEAPSVSFASCPADVTLGSAVSATWSASDPSSGLQTAASGAIPLATATLGTKTVSTTSKDKVGHQTTATCSYRVIYNFSGFFAPLQQVGGLQDWKAGDGMQVSFDLNGDQGLGVFAVGYPQSAQVDCATVVDVTTGDATVSKQGLTFVRGQGRYRYLWVTKAEWVGTCRQLVVKLVDGTYHRASFRFG